MRSHNEAQNDSDLITRLDISVERTSTVELQKADFSAESELPAVWTSIIEVFRFVKKFSSTEKAASAAFCCHTFCIVSDLCLIPKYQ